MASPAEAAWPALPFEGWQATCHTLHSHTQLLGKLAVALAPPEPQLQHGALRLTARGWETAPLPAPDGSGLMVAALDLHAHEAVIEHGDGRSARVPLAPDRPVSAVTREVLAKVQELVGPLRINLQPQEVPWTVPLDEDHEHCSYVPAQVSTYFAAATRVALVLAALRAPYRGRVSPVNAWWGSFDLAVSFYSGRSVDPSSKEFIARNSGDAQQIEVGWWPGDARYPRPAFYAYAAPAPDRFAQERLAPDAARWEPTLGEFVLDWDDLIMSDTPFDTAVAFGRSAIAAGCAACEWDPALAASAVGEVPPLH